MEISGTDAPTEPAVPWVLHSFGYRAGLPQQSKFDCRLVFDLARKVVVVSMPTEPVGSPGELIISPIGPMRAIFSVVADAPHVHHQRVLGVKVEIGGLAAGAVEIPKKEDASPSRCHSIVLGDPQRFTYDRDERLAIRNAIWRIEEAKLSKELTRMTIPGLQTDLLLESGEKRMVPEHVMFAEVCRQLKGAMREDSWGYLWNRPGLPSPKDGPLLAMSPDMTETMNEHLHSVTETIERACGVKPFHGGFESGTDVLDTVAFALVAMRRGVPAEKVARPVMAALHNYGKQYDIRKLRSRNESR